MLGFSDTDVAAEKRRAAIVCVIAGLLYGASWWIYIAGFADGVRMDNEVTRRTAGYAWLPLFGTTVAFVMCVGGVGAARAAGKRRRHAAVHTACLHAAGSTAWTGGN